MNKDLHITDKQPLPPQCHTKPANKNPEPYTDEQMFLCCKLLQIVIVPTTKLMVTTCKQGSEFINQFKKT
jgi:hypothetical protein